MASDGGAMKLEIDLKRAGAAIIRLGGVDITDTVSAIQIHASASEHATVELSLNHIDVSGSIEHLKMSLAQPDTEVV